MTSKNYKELVDRLKKEGFKIKFGANRKAPYTGIMRKYFFGRPPEKVAKEKGYNTAYVGCERDWGEWFKVYFTKE